MNKPSYVPQDYDGIEIAKSVNDVLCFKMKDSVSALLYPRKLRGDFNRLAYSLLPFRNSYGEGTLLYDQNRVSILQLEKARGTESVEVEAARDQIIKDMYLLFGAGLSSVSLRVLPHDGYLRVDSANVHFPHLDGVRRICSAYNSPATKYIRNDQAVHVETVSLDKKKSSLNELKEAFKKRGIPYTIQFDRYVIDLDAKHHSFAAGDLWLQRGYEHSTGLPGFLHYAPEVPVGAPPRLFLCASK